MNTSNGCPKCGRKDLRTLTWRELGIEETSLGCWDCDWATYPPGINADNWQQKMHKHKRQLDFEDFEEDRGSPRYWIANIIMNIIFTILFFWCLYSRGR